MHNKKVWRRNYSFKVRYLGKYSYDEFEFRYAPEIEDILPWGVIEVDEDSEKYKIELESFFFGELKIGIISADERTLFCKQ